MPGSMSQADLVADLKASLQDAADVFSAANDADFKRHLDMAALDFTRFRPRTMLGQVTLVADQVEYAAPSGCMVFKSSLWGVSRAKPWETSWPGRLPNAMVVEGASSRELHLSPPPSAEQITVLGATYKFYYFARHVIDATAANTSIQSGDRGLLLLRAQAEAMKEMAMRNIKKPVQMRDGLSSAPRNGTPSALYEILWKQFEKAAA